MEEPRCDRGSFIAYPTTAASGALIPPLAVDPERGLPTDNQTNYQTKKFPFAGVRRIFAQTTLRRGPVPQSVWLRQSRCLSCGSWRRHLELLPLAGPTFDAFSRLRKDAFHCRAEAVVSGGKAMWSWPRNPDRIRRGEATRLPAKSSDFGQPEGGEPWCARSGVQIWISADSCRRVGQFGPG